MSSSGLSVRKMLYIRVFYSVHTRVGDVIWGSNDENTSDPETGQYWYLRSTVKSSISMMCLFFSRRSVSVREFK